MKLTPKWKKPKTPVQQGFSAKEKVRYHPNYEIWTNKGKYRLKKANISRFWLIFFDFENILRNNYAPFGCNYAPDWCIFLHLVIIKIGEINELKFKAPPPNCEKANRCCGAWDTSTEYPCLCSRRAHKVRLPGNACQPEPSSPVRTAYSVWRSVFADLGIAFFDTGTAP